MDFEKKMELSKGMIDSIAEGLFMKLHNFKPFNYTEWSYRNFIQGKKVLISGGLDSDYDPLLEKEYDVHVRVNSHVLRQGGRCDVLYHTCVADPDIGHELAYVISVDGFVFLNHVDGDYEIGNLQSPTYLDFLLELKRLLPQVDVGYFASGEWEEKNPYGPECEWLNQLHKRYKTKFFTGVIALADVMRFEPEALYVQGMNLFVDRTNGNPFSQVESHPMKGIIDFMFEADCLGFVEYSDTLKKALSRYMQSVPIEDTAKDTPDR